MKVVQVKLSKFCRPKKLVVYEYYKSQEEAKKYM